MSNNVDRSDLPQDLENVVAVASPKEEISKDITLPLKETSREITQILGEQAPVQEGTLEHQQAGWFLETEKGEYREMKKVGEGQFGSVWKAKGPDGTEKAIKILNARDELSELYTEREMKALKKLNHPNIVKIEEIGEISVMASGSRQKRPFLVTELLEHSFDDIAGQIATMNSRKLMDFLEKSVVSSAMGLEAAHQQGVLHRDVKLANIMMRKNGEGVLIDFGMTFDMKTYLEHFYEETEKRGEKRVKNSYLGTLIFMAPEYITDEYLPGSPVSDWYSFAASLYQMLTGDTVVPLDIEEPHEIIRWVEQYRRQERGTLEPSKEYHEATTRIAENLDYAGIGPNLKSLLKRLLRPATVRRLKTEEGEIREYRVLPGENVAESFRKAINKDKKLFAIRDMGEVVDLLERAPSIVEHEDPLYGEDKVDQRPSFGLLNPLEKGDAAAVTVYTPKGNMRVKIELGDVISKVFEDPSYTYFNLRKAEIKAPEERERLIAMSGLDPSESYEFLWGLNEKLIIVSKLEIKGEEIFKKDPLYEDIKWKTRNMSQKNKKQLRNSKGVFSEKGEKAVREYLGKKGIQIFDKKGLQKVMRYIIPILEAEEKHRTSPALSFDTEVNIAYYQSETEPVYLD